MSNTEDAKPEQAHGQGKTTPVTPAPVNENGNATEHAEKTEQDGHQGVSDEAIVRLTRALVWWTAVLAVGTMGLGIVAFFQWKELNKTDHTLRDTLVAQRESSERQLRAYVSVYAASLINFGTEKPILANINIRNSGQTPAYKLTGMLKMGVRPYPLSDPLDALDDPPGNATLGAGVTAVLPVQLARPLTQLEVTDVRAGVAALYVWGEINYFDAFGAKRYTRFRYLHGALHNHEIGEIGPDKEGNEAN